MGMMYFQVEEDKVDKIAGHLEKALQCVEEMKSGGMSGQRGYYGYRNDGMSGERRWGNQYGGGYTNRRDYDDMDGGYRGNRMPPYVDPMYR